MKSRRTTAELRGAIGWLRPKPACGPWRASALLLSGRRAYSCEPENRESLPCDVPWAGMSSSSKRSSPLTPPQACRVNYKRRKHAVSRSGHGACHEAVTALSRSRPGGVTQQSEWGHAAVRVGSRCEEDATTALSRRAPGTARHASGYPQGPFKHFHSDCPGARKSAIIVFANG